MSNDRPECSLCCELRVLLRAMGRSLEDGRKWLESRIVPGGKVTRQRNFNFFGKPLWGLWSAGSSKNVIKKLLDHVAAEALQSNGDFWFPEESESARNGFRLYRALYCLMVAAEVRHPLARNPRVLERLKQYQGEKTGAVFNFIGDDPRDPKPDPFYCALLTSTSIHLFLKLGWRDRAQRAGDYLARMVAANRPHMRKKGVFYTQADLNGKLITKIPSNKGWCFAVSNAKPKQEFWQIGAIMAALTKLGGRHLKSALELLQFESKMLPESYEWPQKCKLAWGGGEILKLSGSAVAAGADRGSARATKLPRSVPAATTDLGSSALTDLQLALAYRVTRNTVVNTFLDAQWPDGSWAGDHYPLQDDAPELDYDYKLLRGLANAPRQPTNSKTCVWFTPEEMSGEFLGEMAVARQGVRLLLTALEKEKQ